MDETVSVALELEGPAGELGAEGDRLGVDAVRPPGHDGVAVLLSTADDRLLRAVEAGEDERARLAHLERRRRVEDVRGGEAVVEPPSGRAEALGNRVDEGGEVVLRPLPISATPSGDGTTALARASAAASRGTAPTSAQASSAASSTSSQRASLPSSDQTCFMAGRE
jgi:hypothetical protein